MDGELALVYWNLELGIGDRVVVGAGIVVVWPNLLLPPFVSLHRKSGGGPSTG